MVSMLAAKRIFPMMILVCIVYSGTGGCREETMMKERTEKPQSSEDVGSVAFREVWAFLRPKEVDLVDGSEPFTDILYHSASMDDTGRLTRRLVPPDIPDTSGIKPRLHLIVAERDAALMHKALRKDLPLRKNLIEDIVRFSEAFQGVQINFEPVRPADGRAYVEFIAELRKRLPEKKMLSVDLPMRLEPDPAYDYEAMAAIADRVLVMIYDQNHRSGPPRPMATLPMCAKAVAYAQRTVPAEKLVMGFVVYGRAWREKVLKRPSMSHAETVALMSEVGKTASRDADGPHFTYQTPARMQVFFEDTRSLLEKLRRLESAGVMGATFWRVGLEPHDLWPHIHLHD